MYRDDCTVPASHSEMSSANTPTFQIDKAPLSPEDLARVENALEDIHLKELKSDVPNPPAVFGAGGPMSAA